VKALFASWRDWAEKAGEFVGGQKAFSQKLIDRGFTRRRSGKARGFDGIGLEWTAEPSHE
jgi:putative DNA primase/helicase